MTYDSTHERVILFGGSISTGYNNETWVYNYTDNSWTNITTTRKPSKSASHSMVYDSTYDRTILFGGQPAGGDDETWVFSPHLYSQQGIYDSKNISLDSIYKITGEILWTPVVQPTGISLMVQVGISNTTAEADFVYTALQGAGFAFEGNGKYIKYRVIFESGSLQIDTPLLEQTIIYYTLEDLSSGDGDIPPSPPSDDGLIPGMIIGAIIAAAVMLGIMGIERYSKNKGIVEKAVRTAE